MNRHRFVSQRVRLPGRNAGDYVAQADSPATLRNMLHDLSIEARQAAEDVERAMIEEDDPMCKYLRPFSWEEDTDD